MTKIQYQTPELLAPGGSLSKAKTALSFGADAVYIGGDAFGLRANAENFTLEQMAELVEFANSLGKKVYVTLNILPRSREIPLMCDYAQKIADVGVHGVIVSDLGAFTAIHKAVPELPIHVSTQANNLNAETCRFWHDQGAVRVNLARELSLEEIREIHENLEDAPIGLEIFVHGAMCMAYSGRCMLSDYLTSRSSNRGDCAQPCRWKYHLSEEARPGDTFPIEETDRGTFLFNSKDLCLLEYIPDLVRAGADALKIEGRMKSDFYVAVTVRAYRIALDYVMDALARGEDGRLSDALKEELLREVCSVSHRDYSTGFFLGDKGSQIYGSSSYIRESDFVGLVTDCVPGEGGYRVTVSQRGNFGLGDEVEFVSPAREVQVWTFTEMENDRGEQIDRAPHAVMNVHFKTPFPVEKGAMMRRFKVVD